MWRLIVMKELNNGSVNWIISRFRLILIVVNKVEWSKNWFIICFLFVLIILFIVIILFCLVDCIVDKFI